MGSGNITINSNAPFILDNGIISSDTFGSGKGGNIQISAPSISLTNGAQLSASTNNVHTGGNITLVASDRVELSGKTTNIFKGFFVQNDSRDISGLPPGTYLGGLSSKWNYFPTSRWNCISNWCVFSNNHQLYW
ncbi:MAG: hypothetical protein ACYTXT_09985 [Nostoc sp.]